MDEDSTSGAPTRATRTSEDPPLKSGQKHDAPQQEPAGEAGEGGNPSAHAKRRRGLGIVTPNACTECRKKRAKCDGKKPCGRCRAQKNIECVYEIPVRQSKDNLRTEIEALRRSQQQNDTLFSALVRTDLGEDILQRLRHGHTVEDISDWLATDPTPPAASSSQGTAGTPALPSYAQPSDARSGITLPSLSGYPGGFAGAGGYNPMGMTTQLPPLKHDFDPHSPWNFSNQSHTTTNRSDSHPDIMQWTAEPHKRVATWGHDESDGSRYRGVDQILDPLEDSVPMKSPAAAWTYVTDDAALVQHLLALYFCWEYPTFASLSKEHFLKDFSTSRPRYCSSILVNALLALGCRFSSQPTTRANPDDPYTSGDHFFKEALRLFYREPDHHSLTTIQALGIMSIREASCGRDSESWYYAGQSVRLAVEMGLHRVGPGGDEDELAVQAATFWGAFALDHAWSLATGSLPQCSCFPHLPPKPAIISDIEASLWIPYTDDGAPLQRSCEQPSNVRSVYKCFCELSELVHQSLYVLHSPGKPVTSRDLLGIYTQYLNWYDSIPEVLRLGHNFTPAVLFAHMYYHFAILLLFRPLIKLRIIGSSILPRDVCTQAADAIQGLLHSYSQLYTLRRTPSFVPYFVLTSTIMHLAISAIDMEASSPRSSSGTPTNVKPEDSEGAHSHPTGQSSDTTESESALPPSQGPSMKAAQALRQGIADLTEMSPCHHFAESALNILRYLAKKWEIEVHIPRKVEAKLDDMIESLVRPTTSSLNFFAPNVSDDNLICSTPGRMRRSRQTSQRPARSSPTEGNSAIDLMQGVMAGPPEPPPQIVEPQSERRSAEKGGRAASRGFENVDNPLFWPFPMQGRPMLPDGPGLEEAGFTHL